MQIGELAERLETAQRAVAKGDTNIQDQRDLVARLKEAGVDAGEARQELELAPQAPNRASPKLG